jgi:hypothetical protein
MKIKIREAETFHMRISTVDLSCVPVENTYDKLLAKRYLAGDMKGEIGAYKRRRKSDISPYVGLRKHGNDLEELREYVPAPLCSPKAVANIPEDVLRQVLRQD